MGLQAADCWTYSSDTFADGEDTENWKTIALAVPGRSNKACRKRWKHSLHPDIKKTPWSPEEDELLVQLHNEYPGRWALIGTSPIQTHGSSPDIIRLSASKISGRTDDACAKRYREALDPNLKKDEWTDEEDSRLLDCYTRLGASWGKVGEELGRSGLACRNRWRMLERRKRASERRASTSRSPTITRKRKRKDSVISNGAVEDDTSDYDDREPGPSRRRLSSSTSRFQSEPQAEGHTSSHTVRQDLAQMVIDPSIIPMALGKCPCGCASGAQSCQCASTNTTLNFANDPTTILPNLDWDTLFPYLQSELPNIFTEPPFGAPSPALDFTTVQLALDSLSRTQSSRCSCTGSCCSIPTAGSVQSTTGCCSSGASSSKGTTASCCNGSILSTPEMAGSVQSSQKPPGLFNAPEIEATKLVLDLASTMHKHPHRASPANQPPAAPSSGTCQAPASQLLVSILEQYQQQRSNPPSNSATGMLSTIALPDPSGCGCGCDPPQADGMKGSVVSRMPQPATSAPVPSALSCCGSNGEVQTEAPSHPPSGSAQHPYTASGGCCGSRKPGKVIAADSLDAMIVDVVPPASDLPTLPRYIPGCGCGCSPDASEGTCSCGCVGICLCGTPPEIPATVPPWPTSMPSLPLVDMIASDPLPITVNAPEPVKSPPLALPPPTSFTALLMAATGQMPSYIPGCGCGCATNAPAGACSCGCEGICCCASSDELEQYAAQLPASMSDAWSVTGTLVTSNAMDETPSIAEPDATPVVGSTQKRSCCSKSPAMVDSPDTTASSPSPSSSSRLPQSGIAPSHRLSAVVPAPIPAYACGHPTCWVPSDMDTPEDEDRLHPNASRRYYTSGELMEHRRNAHEHDDETAPKGTGPNGGWLFRCGLIGCEKGWKVCRNTPSPGLWSDHVPFNYRASTAFNIIYNCPKYTSLRQLKWLSQTRLVVIQENQASLPVRLLVNRILVPSRDAVTLTSSWLG